MKQIKIFYYHDTADIEAAVNEFLCDLYEKTNSNKIDVVVFKDATEIGVFNMMVTYTYRK